VSRKSDKSDVFNPSELSDEELVLKYRSLVAKVARNTEKKLKAPIPIDDLMGYGYHGLLDAKQRYSLENRVNFGTYAYYRILGAVLDGARVEGWVPRRDIKRLQALAAANDVISSQADAEANAPRPRTLEEAADRISELVGEVCMVVQLTDDAAAGLHVEAKQEHGILAEQQSKLLKQAVSELSDTERDVIKKHYYENVCMADIARTYGRSKSWASRVHTQALDKLSKSFEH